MTRRLASLLLLTLFAVLGTAGSASAGKTTYVVALDESLTDPDAVTEDLESRLRFHARTHYRHALSGFAASLTTEQVDELREEPAVSFATADRKYKAAGWAALSTSETVPVGIRRIEAVQVSQIRQGSNTTVAVLDTGVDLSNPDLNAVAGTNCIKPGTAPQDDNGHGTNVAGIVGARNTGAGVVGVSPGTRVVSVKVLNANKSGTLSQILCGIDWVTANAGAYGIRVANMSIAGGGANDGNCGNSNNDAYHRAICRSTTAGVTYVAAAGNAKTGFGSTVPAAYPEVLAVTAMSDNNGRPGGGGTWSGCKSTEKDDYYASYSNWAPSTAAAHTIAAPGTCILSTGIGSTRTTFTGTSQAAPHVAGAVALCIDSGGTAGPCAGLSPSGVIARMRSNAEARESTRGFYGDPLKPVTGRYYGNLVDATY